MPDPVEFASRSPRYGLPMLFAGQAQKEFYVNEAHALADALLHPAIEGEANTPPVEPADGGCWLVGSSPTEAWSGHAGALASFQAGIWLFVEPRDGMRVLDRSTGQEIRFRRGWQAAGMTHLPQGGGVIDAEARATIDQLVEALVVGVCYPATGSPTVHSMEQSAGRSSSATVRSPRWMVAACSRLPARLRSGARQWPRKSAHSTN